ncbi:DUF222 domain-containing protein [Microbacterium sp.]|uniref:HNH endonuclease signature motif containing protein n=1 Tax=Microbacterium sp. TaxID=51671 RepID=UPI0037C74A28
MKKTTHLYAGAPRGLDADVAWHELIESAEVIGDDPAEWAVPPGDPTVAEAPRDALAALEDAHARGRVLVADQYRTMSDLLRDAEHEPDPWVGPDPTLDPAWTDPRGRRAARVRRDRQELAVRAAVADIAVRLRMSEATVRAMANTADTLRLRCPKLWALFLGGAVSERSARIASSAAADLPADDPAAWARFDDQVAHSAQVLAPGRLRVRVRVVRDRVHPTPTDDRHAQAAQHRTMWLTDGDDGMSTLTVEAPTVRLHAAWNGIDEHVRRLQRMEDESRTLAQLRADVATDLLTGGDERIDPVIAVTVPVLSLLGEHDAPAMLEGCGPVDAPTAERLAGKAKSWIRVLTDPVTGTVLDVDRAVRRPPAALRRWVQQTQKTCTFPGCARPARTGDVDHRVDWQHGGPTAAANLSPKCRHHHRVKHETLWRHEQNPDTGREHWTSPTGHRTALDPPPF